MSKVRPAMVVSSNLYHAEKPDLMLAALTSKVAEAIGPLDYKLQDWKASSLQRPTAFKPIVETLEPILIVRSIGQISTRDAAEIENRLRLMMDLQK